MIDVAPGSCGDLRRGVRGNGQPRTRPGPAGTCGQKVRRGGQAVNRLVERLHVGHGRQILVQRLLQLCDLPAVAHQLGDQLGLAAGLALGQRQFCGNLTERLLPDALRRFDPAQELGELGRLIESALAGLVARLRSEERRVGKECRL